MIEMRVRDQRSVDIVRRQSDLGHDRFGRLPTCNAEAVGNFLGEVFVVEADIDHRDMPLAFDDDVAIRDHSSALIVRPIDHGAHRIVVVVAIFQDPD